MAGLQSGAERIGGWRQGVQHGAVAHLRAAQFRDGGNAVLKAAAQSRAPGAGTVSSRRAARSKAVE